MGDKTNPLPSFSGSSPPTPENVFYSMKTSKTTFLKEVGSQRHSATLPRKPDGRIMACR